MSWKYPHASLIWIFPVGRGNCAFLRTKLNHGFILDMAAGHDGFDIKKFIVQNFLPLLDKYPADSERRIAQAVLSQHPHRDHIARCGELKDGSKLHPHLVTCPNNKVADEAINWWRVDNPKGQRKRC